MTPKQAMFVAEYLIDGNATRAAIAAGFSEASAAVTGARLLKQGKVAAAIAARHARRVLKLEEYADLIDQQLVNASLLDVGRLYDAEGKPIPIHLLDEDVRRAIASVEDETQQGGKRVQRVKIVDKLRAMELLGKRAGLFTDVHEHKGHLTLEQLVCGEPASGTDQAA